METAHTTENGEAVKPFDISRFLGLLNDTGQSTVKVLLEPNPETGEMASCQIGAYVLIRTGKLCVFAQVISVTMEMMQGRRMPVATLNLLNTVDIAQQKVTPGVSHTPPLESEVYVAHPSIVKMIAESNARKGGSAPTVSLDIARLADGYDTPITITPEMLFGRHMAILGTTGAGKSFTLARLVEEVAKHESKMILFDASGEFGTLGDGTLHVYLGDHPYPRPNFFQVSMPYSELIENDLFAIFRPTGEGQAPKLRAAIKTLKLVQRAPHVALNGLVLKANRDKKIFEQEYHKWRDEIESPKAEFDISRLVQQINNECVNPYLSATETGFWGNTNSLDLSQCTPLVNRVQDIIASKNLAPIFQPEDTPSLFTVMERFLDDSQYRILCISLQYLSFEHHAREIVANAAGRYLLEMARAERFQKRPVLVAVDEAHQFLKENMEDLAGDYPLDSFALIAKEGRKYCLHICLGTQRPRDIPESVLSQMGTLIVHRLINDKDRQIIERASGEGDGNTLSALPTLTQGYGIILGADFPAPLRVKINLPLNPPMSRSADFQNWWNSKPSKETRQQNDTQPDLSAAH